MLHVYTLSFLWRSPWAKGIIRPSIIRYTRRTLWYELLHGSGARLSSEAMYSQSLSVTNMSALVCSLNKLLD